MSPRNFYSSLLLWLIGHNAFTANLDLPLHQFSIPKAFVENKGQILNQSGRMNEEVLYLFSKGNFNFQIRRDGFSFEIFESQRTHISRTESEMKELDQEEKSGSDLKSCRFDVRLSDINPNPILIAEEPAGRFNFYTSVLPSPGFVGVPAFKKISLLSIYPGIDLVFRILCDSMEALKYEFIIHPGADPGNIKMHYDGAGAFSTDESGYMEIFTPFGIIKQAPWYCYLAESGRQVFPGLQYRKRSLRFKSPVYTNETLILDPQILWGTYFGGPDPEIINAEATVDPNGNILLAGTSFSSTFIASDGAYQSTYGGDGDIFVAKFNPEGTFLWATYLGGNKQEVGFSITTDAQANIFVAGKSQSTSGIATTGAFQPMLKGGNDNVLAKFSSSGTIIWSTYFGGTKEEFARGVCIDENGNVYITGQTHSSSGIATLGAYQTVMGGKGDCFLAKFSPSGSRIWSTYLGGPESDRAHGACAGIGNVYITGTTESSSGIATAGVHQTKMGGMEDVLLAKFNNATGQIYWSTYYGGKINDHGRSVRADPDNSIFITGFTNSFDNIATPGSFQSELTSPLEAPGHDGIVAKFGPNGQLIWGTYFGGERNDVLYGLELSDSFLVAGGLTTSTSKIATPGAFQQTLEVGDQAGALIKLDKSGNRIWSTYMGTSGDASIQDLALAENDLLYLALHVEGDNLVSSQAHQTVYHGNEDYLIYKFYDEEDCFDQYELNNKKYEAKMLIPIHEDESFLPNLGSIFSSADKDWYKTTVTADEPNICVILSQLTKDYNIEWRNASGLLISSTEGGGVNPDTLIINNAPPGDYLIKIAHNINAFDALNCYQVNLLKSETPFLARISDLPSVSISTSVATATTMICSPNPASNEVQITISGISEIEGILRLQHISGKVSHELQFYPNSSEMVRSVDLRNLNSGVYIVQWVQESKFISKKLVIMH